MTIEDDLGWLSVRSKIEKAGLPVEFPSELLDLRRLHEVSTEQQEAVSTVLGDMLRAAGFAASALTKAGHVKELRLAGGLAQAVSSVLLPFIRHTLNNSFPACAQEIKLSLSIGEDAPLLGIYRLVNGEVKVEDALL